MENFYKMVLPFSQGVILSVYKQHQTVKIFLWSVKYDTFKISCTLFIMEILPSPVIPAYQTSAMWFTPNWCSPSYWIKEIVFVKISCNTHLRLNIMCWKICHTKMWLIICIKLLRCVFWNVDLEPSFNSINDISELQFEMKHGEYIV